MGHMQVIKVLQTAGRARSVAWSPDGEHLAVGVVTGGVQVFAFHPRLQQMHWGAPAKDAVSVLAYSPDGRYLAAGSHDQCAFRPLLPHTRYWPQWCVLLHKNWC